jgi:ClpP class serine protease
VSATTVLWIILLLLALQPVVARALLRYRRLSLIQDLQKKRSSRVIVLIHRQEQVSLLGIPFYRYIDVDDSEEILRAIRLTPRDVPIDLILHTPGGLVLAAEQIALALTAHQAGVTVMVPHYAMSGGTLIAMAADEILMDEYAVLGPVDPQLGEYPAVSILRAVELKDANELEDGTLIMADMAQKAMRQVRDLVETILLERDRYGAPDEAAVEPGEEEPAEDDVENAATGDAAPSEVVEPAAAPAAGEPVWMAEAARRRRAGASRPAGTYALIEAVTSGQWTHDYPITAGHARELGLPIACELPEQVYELMRLYPQAGRGRPSVEYIPLPIAPPARKRKP